MSGIQPPGWFQAEVARLGNQVLAGRLTSQQAAAMLAGMIVDGGGEFLEDVLAASETGGIMWMTSPGGPAPPGTSKEHGKGTP